MNRAEIFTKITPIAPLAIVAAFVLFSVFVWLPRGGPDQIASAPELKELNTRLSSGSERLAGLIEVTNERPLFHASRKPVATPEAAKPAEPVLSLLGVIKEDNGETVAFVKVSTTGALYRIGEGETVGQWRILEIGTEEVTVSKQGRAPYQLKIGG